MTPPPTKRGTRVSKLSSPNFEGLEARTLMSFSASVNFQPPTSTVPGGYLVDSGAAYATRSNGATYGWSATNATMQDRNSSNSPDERYDTLAHMQYGGTFSWSIALPNDTYAVHVVAGDPSYTDSVYKINAENVTVVSGTPSSSNHWIEGTALVTVADGKLTISNATGSSNNKICYIDIESATVTDVPPTTTPTLTTPAAPTNLNASATTSQVTLNWTDNSGIEDGFRVDRSTDGGVTFTQLGTVGANVGTFTDSNVSTSSTYSYRVRSYAGSVTSTWSNVATVTTRSDGGGSLPSGSTGYFDAANVNTAADPSKVIPILRDLGVKGVRLWVEPGHWTSRYNMYELQLAKTYKNAGFSTTVLLTCKESTNYGTAKQFFDWVQSGSGVRSAVDRWEIENEPDLTSYYAGGLNSYVNNVLRAGWDSLHATGETVVGGAACMGVDSMKTMVAAGYLKYCDIANIHPYATSVTGQINFIKGAKALIGSKPLTMTEWNFHPPAGTSAQGWADMLDAAHPYVAQNTDSAFYYRLVYKTSTQAGPAGLIFDDYTQHNPFYSTYKSWKSGTVTAATTKATSTAFSSTTIQ